MQRRAMTENSRVACGGTFWSLSPDDWVSTSEARKLIWRRPGTTHASLGNDDDPMRLVNTSRRKRLGIKIYMRADAGFALADGGAGSRAGSQALMRSARVVVIGAIRWFQREWWISALKPR